MALTVTEATAVNTLLTWLLFQDRRIPVSELEARTAARTLAESAHKRLYAGLTASDVETRWVVGLWQERGR